MKPIAILTDFGSKDYYTGVMKGVIERIAPGVRVIDITNDVPPQNIKAASFILSNSYKYFPEGTIFLIVVDPGVGTERKGIAIETGDFFFIAPDNGVLTYVLQNEKVKSVVEIGNPDIMLPQVSETFHGRDIFAPASAYIAKGMKINELGDAIDTQELVRLDGISPLFNKDGSIEASVAYIDHFGNLIFPFKHDDIKEFSSINIGTFEIREISDNYCDAAVGKPLAYFGSCGFLEIGVRNGSAKAFFNADYETKIKILRKA